MKYGDLCDHKYNAWNILKHANITISYSVTDEKAERLKYHYVLSSVYRTNEDPDKWTIDGENLSQKLIKVLKASLFRHIFKCWHQTFEILFWHFKRICNADKLSL